MMRYAMLCQAPCRFTLRAYVRCLCRHDGAMLMLMPELPPLRACRHAAAVAFRLMPSRFLALFSKQLQISTTVAADACRFRAITPLIRQPPFATRHAFSSLF